jgi:hypothetical protein
VLAFGRAAENNLHFLVGFLLDSPLDSPYNLGMTTRETKNESPNPRKEKLMLHHPEFNTEREAIRKQIREITSQINDREETPEERRELDRLTDLEMDVIRRYREWKKRRKRV